MNKVQLFLVVGCLTFGCKAATLEITNGDVNDMDTSPATEPGDSSSDDNALFPIEETHWQLESLLADSGDMSPLVPDTGIDIKFTNGEFGGSAGCNRVFGRYTADGDSSLGFAPEMGSTQMACPPPINEQERRYLSLLGSVVGWSSDSGRLSLLDQEGSTLLIFKAAEPASVEGVVWQATGINNGKGGVVTTASTGLATATFADGKVSGSGGCNNFNATYEIDGDRIAIGRAMATRKACLEPEGIMDQELQYFEALSRATIYSLAPGKLELRDEEGSLQVGFKVQ